jgi:hypothetical protein
MTMQAFGTPPITIMHSAKILRKKLTSHALGKDLTEKAGHCAITFHAFGKILTEKAGHFAITVHVFGKDLTEKSRKLCDYC